jgi:hypothetical protein
MSGGGCVRSIVSIRLACREPGQVVIVPKGLFCAWPAQGRQAGRGEQARPHGGLPRSPSGAAGPLSNRRSSERHRRPCLSAAAWAMLGALGRAALAFPLRARPPAQLGLGQRPRCGRDRARQAAARPSPPVAPLLWVRAGQQGPQPPVRPRPSRPPRPPARRPVCAQGQARENPVSPDPGHARLGAGGHDARPPSASLGAGVGSRAPLGTGVAFRHARPWGAPPLGMLGTQVVGAMAPSRQSKSQVGRS